MFESGIFTRDDHVRFMGTALREAACAESKGEVPAGCVIVRMPPPEAGSEPVRVVAKAHNMTESLKDPTAHAEILAITQAAGVCGDWRLTDCVLYVTKEPCPMCAGAIVLARLPLVVWGVDDPKRGGQTVFGIFDNPGVNHHPNVVRGVCAEECAGILKTFFRKRRSCARSDADGGAPGIVV